MSLLSSKQLALATCALTLAAVNGTAVAADTVLEEVIVTVQKRNQDLQDVPVSLTAYSQADIENFGFEKATQVVQQAPNVYYRTQGTTPLFSIRGVSLLDSGDSNEPPIAFYVDDVYSAVIAGQDNLLFDLKRVEVLRGPQGTLFGRNATGGLIHYHTAGPTSEFEGYAELSFGSNSRRSFEGAVSGAVSDAVRARLSIARLKDDGYQRNVANNTGLAANDVTSGRLQIEVDISENADLLLRASAGRQRGSSVGYGFYGILDPLSGAACSPTQVASGACVDSAGFQDPSPDPTRVFSDEQDLPFDLDTSSLSANLTWNLGNELMLTSVTAFSSLEKDQLEDGDASANTDLPLTFEYRLKATQVSQELRLAKDFDRSRSILGAFFLDIDKDDGFVSILRLVPLFGSTLGFQNEYEIDTRSWAVFGQSEWDISDSLTIVAGLRYTAEEKVLNITDSVEAPSPSFPATEKIDTTRINGRFGLEWHPRDGFLGYLTASTGFKSGAFNTTLVVPGDTAPVGEEVITAYEAGIKTDFPSEKARLNISAFYYDYRDAQSVAGVTGAAGFPVVQFTNVGDADVYGIEAELTSRVTNNLEGSLAIGLLQTELSTDPLTTIDGFPINGNDLPHAPSANINGSLRYTFPTTSTGTFAVQSDFRWQSEAELRADNDPLDVQDAYAVFNVHASWESPTNDYYVKAGVNNITDESYANGSYTIRNFGFRAVIWGEPRLYRVEFGRRF